MPYENWDALYHSTFQWPFAVILLPIAFLVYRAAGRPAAARAVEARCDEWVQRWALGFAVLTIVDPLATGPLAQALGGGTIATVLAFVFVWIGDFRILSLLFGCAAVASGGGLGAALRRAAATTCIVPAIAGVVYAALGFPDMKWLWLTYEISFFVLALWFARVWLPRTAEALALGDPLVAFLRATASFSAMYYALWISADLVLLAGFDEGWALRFVPNQLYYALTVPLLYQRFYASRG